MSRLVDERVVKMDFDNSKFEKNTKQSMSTIEKLKASLNFSNSSKTLNSAFSSVDTSPLTNGISYAQKGFTALEVMGITALSNITNKVVDLGLQIAKSLSLDSVIQAWSEYGDKTTSVATLIAQGFNSDEVYKQLDKLKFFTDETSYDYQTMVDNIGKFTAAGKSLDDSVQAMMGIANWAALSGQNATKASQAMYQLSQAIGAGAVRYEDYKSIQTAQMDTKEFRQTVLDTAVAAGKLQRTITGLYITESGNSFGIDNFTEYLTTDQWFTSDVLVDTLKKYSGAVDSVYEAVNNGDYDTASEAIAGMEGTLDELAVKAFKAAQECRTFSDVVNYVKKAVSSSLTSSLEKIFGKSDEAIKLWTDLANALYEPLIKSYDVLTAVLDKWNELGGRSDLFDNTEENTGAFWNLFNAIISVVDVIKSAWNTIFPISEFEEEDEVVNDLATRFKSFTENLKETSEKLKPTVYTLSFLKDIFEALFSIIKLGKKIFEGLKIAIEPLVKEIKNLFSSIYYGIVRLSSPFTDFANETEIFKTIGKNIARYLTFAIDLVRALYAELNIFIESKTGKMIAEHIDTIKNKIKDFFNNIKPSEKVLDVEKSVESIKKTIKQVIPSIKSIISYSKYVITFIKDLANILNNLVKSKTGKTIGEHIDTIKKKINDFFKKTNVSNNFKTAEETIEIIKKKVKQLSSSIKSYISIGKNIVLGIAKGIKDGFIKVKESISKICEKIKKVFCKLFGIHSPSKTFQEYGSNFIDGLVKGIKDGYEKVKEAIKGIYAKIDASFIGDAIRSIKEFFSDFSFDPMIEMLKGFRSFLSGFISFMSPIISFFGKVFGFIGEKLKEFSKAIKEVLGDTEIKDIFKAAFWTSVVALIAKIVNDIRPPLKELRLVLDSASGYLDAEAFKAISEAIKNIAIAIIIIVGALILLSTIDENKLAASTIVLGSIIAGIVALIKTMSGMATSIKDLASFKKTMKEITAITAMASAFKKLATSILIIVIALKIIATMEWTDIAKGLVVIGALTLMGLSISKYITKAKAINFGLFVQSMKQLASALIMITIPLLAYRYISWEDMGKAGVVLAGLTLVSMLIAKYMTKAKATNFGTFASSLLVLAAALTLLSIPIFVLGNMPLASLLKGLGAILAVVGVLALISTKLKVKQVESLSLFSISLGLFSISMLLLAKAVKKFGSMDLTELLIGFGAIAAFIIIFALTATLFSKISTPLLSMAGAFVIFAAGALIFAVALNLIVTAIKGFIEVGNMITENSASVTVAFTTIVNAILASIVQAVPQISSIIESLINGIFNHIETTVTRLTELVPKITTLIQTILSSVLQLINDNGPALIETVISLIDTTLSSLSEHMPSIMESIMSIISTILTSIAENIGELTQTGIDIFLNFMAAVTERIQEIIDAVNAFISELIDGALRFAREELPGWIDDLFQLAMALIDGVGEALDKNAENIAHTLVELIGHILSFVLKFSVTFTKEIFPMLWGFLTDIWNAVAEWAGPVLKDIGGFFSDIWKKITGFFSDTWKKITGWFDDLWKEMSSIGEDLINGLIEGLTAGWNALTGAVSAVGGWIGDTFCNIFGIHSPSKVFAKYGEYMDEGLAQGLKNGASSVYDEIKDVSSTANNKFSSAVSKIADTLSNGISDELTIRPVMDLTDIQNGTNQIYSMMNGVNGYSISGSANLASSVSNSINSKNSAGAQGGSSNSTNSNENYSYQNTFYISGDNSKDIADEVARALQEKIDRRHAVWAT